MVKDFEELPGITEIIGVSKSRSSIASSADLRSMVEYARDHFGGTAQYVSEFREPPSRIEGRLEDGRMWRVHENEPIWMVFKDASYLEEIASGRGVTLLEAFQQLVHWVLINP